MRKLYLGPVLALVVAGGCQQSAPPPPSASSATASARPSMHFESYAEGLARAQREGRPMLVFFTAQWCDYCHELSGEVFTQDAFVRLSREFVCVEVDADREPELCREFRVQGYPTVQFLSPDGVPLNRVVGKQPTHKMVMEMQAALQAIASRPVADRYQR